MGMDFVALMKYGGLDERLSRVLDRLEVVSPPEVQALAGLMQDRGMRNPGHEQAAFWEFTSRPELRDPRLDHRPALPDLGVALWLPEGFSLTFGPDAVEAYHLLRWHFFLTEPDLGRAMLDACVCLARLLGATDCIITSDYSPVVQAFRRGRGFDASLGAAGPVDGERPSVADLYLEIPESQVVRVIERPGKPSLTRHMDWDVGRPPPEGWRRVTTWDSRGYWRPGLPPEAPPGIEEVPVPERPAQAATGATNGGWWQTSGEPDAMLDRLLKQDGADWRKVMLWSCACLRRAWPLLATEPARRAVEVAERFADGQVDRRAVENAAGAARGVRKGDRRANHAAWLLARLCSETHRFPPGDVSGAVIDAVVAGSAEEARAAEREAHAGLLRDIFGPDPLRAVGVEPAWRTPAVATLTLAAYEERQLPGGLLDPARLAVLADALEEAGADAGLLAHLRDPGPHVRGCWVVDLLLGKG